jgi:D-alanyl-D-alanine carboxypeptidase/D-alanyl-D-alanine-endopeptidase (penicillin-binding protein 4)
MGAIDTRKASMSLRISSIIRLACACCAALVLASGHAADALPAAVTQELARQGLPVSALSYRIAPLAGHVAASPPQALGEHRSMNPASAMKLLTTLAALDMLGPAHRWSTAMLADGASQDGELKGNLYLLGGAEPNLGWERLGGMLRTLRNSGIVSIRGDLVLDRSLFQPARMDLGAAPFDDTPDAWYNVIPDALTVSDYLIDYTLSSDASGVVVQTTPPLSAVTVVNRMVLNDLPCGEWDETWRQPEVQAGADGAVRIVLSGAFPRNCRASVALATLERDLYMERLVRALWQELGGQWRGRVREGKVPAGAVKLAERQFETLGETVRTINKASHAVKARLLYLMLGATSTGPAQDATKESPGLPTLERARRRVLDWVAAQGVDPAGIVIENGAGLSRHERLSAAQLLALLQRAASNRWYPEFAASLPIAALDGTMRRRLKDSPAAGSARLKTGTLRDVAALAGYLRDVRGQDWAVAAFVNDPQGDKGRAVLDGLMDWIAQGQQNP